MKLKRLVAIGCIMGILGLGLAQPRQARADTTTDVAIGVGGFVIWVGLMAIAAKLVYGNQPTTTSIEDPLRQYEQPNGEARFVTHCRQEGGGITVVCW